MKTVIGLFIFLGMSGVSQAQGIRMECNRDGILLPFQNSEALQWKASTRNGFRADAHIRGTFLKKYPSSVAVPRFQVKIGPRASDTLEINYYGLETLPQMRRGDVVEACGEFHTAIHTSPDGAVMNETNASNDVWHKDGFLVIRGVLYQD